MLREDVSFLPHVKMDLGTFDHFHEMRLHSWQEHFSRNDAECPNISNFKRYITKYIWKFMRYLGLEGCPGWISSRKASAWFASLTALMDALMHSMGFARGAKANKGLNAPET